MGSSLPTVRRISTSVVKPPPHPRLRCELTPWDLTSMNFGYAQTGLLFAKCVPSVTTEHIIDTLKTSLSTALKHYYPLSGRLATEKAYNEDGSVAGLFIYIDCNGQGADFIHVVAENVTVDDVLSPAEIPAFIRSFFPLEGAINYDGHLEPLVSIQFTELVDGFFLGCSFNHVAGDGMAGWNFFNAWAEIARSGSDDSLSRIPVHDRLFFENLVLPLKLPFSHPDEFVKRFPLPVYRERMIHFSAESIVQLKNRANQECKTTTGMPISSLQSIAALIWRCITRARRLPHDQKTSFILSVDIRARLEPPLSPDYFGNTVHDIACTVTAGELLSNSHAWSASLLHETVASHNNSAIRNLVSRWLEKPVIFDMSMLDSFSVMLASSPRFDIYGCDFGWGKPVRSMSIGANKFDGSLSMNQGREGGGSVDLDICLLPEVMERFETDEELLSVLRAPPEVDVHGQ